MNFTMPILLLLSFSTTGLAKTEDDDSIEPPPQQGKSFFIFGAIFRKWRQRWMGAPDPYYNPPGPIYAGPAFPPAGYYNCPQYGCNPALTYRPAPYEVPNYYNQPYPPNSPPYLQQQLQPQQQLQKPQQQQQQSSVVVYHNQQEQQAIYRPQPAPLPLPPPPPLRRPIPSYGTNGIPANYPAYSVGNSYAPPAIVPLQPSYGNAFGNMQPQQPPLLPGAYVGPVGATPCGSVIYPCNMG